MTSIGNLVAQITADNSLLIQRMREAEQTIKRMEQSTTQSSQIMTRDFGGVERAAGSLGQSFRRLAMIAGTYLSATYITGQLRRSLNDFAEYERSLFRLEAQITATGRAGQITTQELVDMSREIGRATMESQEAVRQAQAILMSFRAVATENMERVLNVAADVSEVMGGSIVSSARQMALALEDPVRGLTMLRRTGTTFTQEQQDMIRALHRSGREFEAQVAILEVMESQYGGTARAASVGLAGALDALAEASKDLRYEIGEKLAPETTRIVKEITAWIDANRELIGQRLDDTILRATNAAKEAWPHIQKIGDGVRGIHNLWQSLPDAVRGPAGLGIIGGMLFGKKGLVLGLATGLIDPIMNIARALDEIEKGNLSWGEFARMNAQELADHFKFIDEQLVNVGKNAELAREKAFLMSLEYEQLVTILREENLGDHFFSDAQYRALVKRVMELKFGVEDVTKSTKDATDAAAEHNRIMAEMEAERIADELEKVNKEYATKTKLLTMSAREQVIYNEAQRRGIEEGTAAHATLAQIINDHYDLVDSINKARAVEQAWADEKIASARALAQIDQTLINAQRELNELRGFSIDPIQEQIWHIMDLALMYEWEWGAIKDVIAALEELRGARIDAAEQAADEAAARERQRILDDFADEYKRVTMSNTEYELHQLQVRYDHYAQHVEDMAALDEWYAKERDRITGGFVRDATSHFLEFRDIGISALKSFEDTLVDVAMTGKLEFKDMADSIIRDLARIAVQKAIMAPLTDWFGGFFANAQGNVYDKGYVQPFARGGIVDQPTVFPFARGVGLMGEAGPEAILPLTRVGGDLGVKAEVGGNVTVNIIEAPGQGGKQARRTGSGGEQIIDVFVEQITNKLAGDIHMGKGPLPAAIERRYGVNRAAGVY